jgi:hypothetical protein
VAPLRRLRRRQVEDGRIDETGCVGPYYPTFAIFNVLIPNGIVVILRLEPIPICLSGHHVRLHAASAFIARFLLLELFSAQESVGPRAVFCLLFRLGILFLPPASPFR